MKLLKKISYEDVNFKWIEDHYDYHSTGTCIYNNELCVFLTDSSEHEKKDNYELSCNIYKLNLFEKIKCIFSQKIFEWMVGYHWTCPKMKNYYIRKPEFIFNLLTCLYYKLPTIIDFQKFNK